MWDDLFGDGKAKANSTKAAGKDAKNKAARGKAKSSNDEEDDLGGLAALIQRKNQHRASKFDDMIAKLEAKAGVKEKRPTDEEFDRIQAEMLARKTAALPTRRTRSAPLHPQPRQQQQPAQRPRRRPRSDVGLVWPCNVIVFVTCCFSMRFSQNVAARTKKARCQTRTRIC